MHCDLDSMMFCSNEVAICFQADQRSAGMAYRPTASPVFIFGVIQSWADVEESLGRLNPFRLMLYN